MDIDLRDSFFQEICDFGMKDSDFVVITADMDVFALSEFKKNYPERYLNIGAAEQNMVNLAAGLASAGKKVLILGILSFISTRSFEQIKLNICGMNLPVIIVGIGPGLSFSFDGPTHHATHDITVMRQLPELRIFHPSDASTAKFVAKSVLDFSVPTYVRLDKGKFKKSILSDIPVENGLVKLKYNHKKLIIFSGTVFTELDFILRKLNKSNDVYSIVNIVQVAPLPNLLIDLLSVAEKIIIIEENSISGGIFNLIAEVITRRKFKVEVEYLLLQQKHFFNYGSRSWLSEISRMNSNFFRH